MLGRAPQARCPRVKGALLTSFLYLFIRVIIPMDLSSWDGALVLIRPDLYLYL